MYEVARGVIGARSLAEVVHLALTGLGTLIPAWRHSVGIIDLRARSYTMYDIAGGAQNQLGPGQVISLEDFGGDLRRLRRGLVDITQDLRESPTAAGSLSGTALQSQLIAPIRHDGLLLGTLNIGHDQPHFFGPEHSEIAVEMAQVLASALGSVALRQELVHAHDRARRASEAKTTFLTHMSHELRTPLNAIVGYVELLQEEPGDTPLSTALPDLARVHASSLHLLRLINDVLDLAKVESGRMEVTLTPVPVAQLLADLEGTVQPLMLDGGNRFEWTCPDELEVMADPLRLRQVLLNLIGNAARFTGQGVITVLATPRAAGLARIEVRDTGVGIAPDRIATLFDPFIQAHDRLQYGGTGLGLAISQRYALRMGSRIEVQSTLDAGACFWLDLYGPPDLTAATSRRTR